jgi:hypothetical protein
MSTLSLLRDIMYQVSMNKISLVTLLKNENVQMYSDKTCHTLFPRKCFWIMSSVEMCMKVFDTPTWPTEKNLRSWGRINVISRCNCHLQVLVVGLLNIIFPMSGMTSVLPKSKWSCVIFLNGILPNSKNFPLLEKFLSILSVLTLSTASWKWGSATWT